MKKIQIFNIPDEVAKANEFLAENPPESVVTVSKGEQCFIFVHFDDNTYPVSYKVAELREFMVNNEKAKLNTTIARGVMLRDLETYEAKLKTAQEELATLESEKAPEDLTKKGIYEWEKTQGEKVMNKKKEVEAIGNSVTNIKNGIEKGKESDDISDLKNELIQKEIDNLLAK